MFLSLDIWFYDNGAVEYVSFALLAYYVISVYPLYDLCECMDNGFEKRWEKKSDYISSHSPLFLSIGVWGYETTNHIMLSLGRDYIKAGTENNLVLLCV